MRRSILINEERGRSPEDGYDFRGYQVYDMYYEKIGKVCGMFVDENDEPGYIGIKVSALGTRTALIPIQALRVNDRQQHVEVSATRDEIEEGPALGGDGELTSKVQRQVLGHYSVLGRRDFG